MHPFWFQMYKQQSQRVRLFLCVYMWLKNYTIKTLIIFERAGACCRENCNAEFMFQNVSEKDEVISSSYMMLPFQKASQEEQRDERGGFGVERSYMLGWS